jgi:hypothetical protein
MSHRRFGADRSAFGVQKKLRLDEPQRQLAILSPVALHEILEVVGDIVARDIAASLDFGGDLFRKVFGPMLQGVEGDNPDGIAELARKQISDDGFRIRALNFGFAVDAPGRAGIVHHQIDGLVCAIRDNGLDEAGLEHCKPQVKEPGFKPIGLNWFRRSQHRDAILSLR